MSYNGYNQYSPYWQHTSGQNTPQNPRQTVGQSTASYQPLSAYQNSQQSTQPSISQPPDSSGGASYGSQVYGHTAANRAGNGRHHDSRAGYTSTNDRASIDGATALGNLAYASSLGRDGSVPSVSNYNRQQSNANYSTASSYGANSVPPMQYRTADERSNSTSSAREDANRRSQQATASPSFGYSSNNAEYPGSSAGNNKQTLPQYSQPRSSSEQHRLGQYSQPPRPTSGQAIQQPRSKPDSQAAPSPTIPTTQGTTNQSQGRKDGGNIRGTAQTRVQTPQPSINRTSSFHTSGQSGGNTTKSKAATNLSANQTATTRTNEASQPPTVDASRQASKPATPVEPQYTTVDPSQVFNHTEYSRRQAAAAAEVAAAKKAADEADAARITATQQRPAQVKVTSAAASELGTEPDSAKKDLIELEMKQMIEKMREYKAKDPSLFTQIWETVKKSQPPQRAPSQSLQGSATSPVVVNGQPPSPSLIQNQLPPESDLPVGDDFPPNFDRGRFPAQRRRRGGSTKVSTSRKSGTPKASKEPAAENQGSPVPPVIGIPTPKVGKVFPDPGSQSMHEAMRQFHQNPKSPPAKAQQTPANNKQATTNTPTRPSEATPSSVPPSQPVPPQSAPPRPGGTYWPESKKAALAEAARIALTSTPPNNTKTITTQEIHELLDQNPSYTQMCEILEYRGFVIDRGQFARILLKAVPDLGSASNTTDAASSTASATPAMPTSAISTPTASNNDTSSNAKAASATPTTGSFGKLVRANSNSSAAEIKMPQPLPYSVPPAAALQVPNGYITPYAPLPPIAEQASKGIQSDGLPRDYRFVDPRTWTPGDPRYHANVTNQGRPTESAVPSQPSFPPYQQPGPMNGQVLDQNRTTNSNGVIPHHPSKQEMARKRTFGEIVDLTTLSDDEELQRHRPKPRNDNENASVPGKSFKNAFDHVTQRQQNSGRTTPKPFKYKYSGRDALLQSYDIIEPMNKRRDALRRSMYNPKTIARDVLLGLGKHPTMAPLNAHLDVLKERFKAVDNESDLSTFRWDLVDPEGEAPAEPSDTDEEATPAVITANRQRPAPMAVMVSSDGVDVAKVDQAPSRTVISGREPGKRGPYKKSGIRSGIQPIDSADTPLQSSTPVQDVSKVTSTKPPDLSHFAYNSFHTPQMDVATPSTAPKLNTPASGPKRKGRPPGAKNKQVRPDKGVPKKIKTPVGETHSFTKRSPIRGGSSVEETPPEGKKPSVGEAASVGKTAPVGSSAIESPNTPIRTGPRPISTTPARPSGLKSSISATTPIDGISVVIPSRSPSVVMPSPHTSAKKASPIKVEIVSKRTPASPPSYTVCRCHWEKCPAELHNLETLKKHVKKHRGAVDGVYPCLWADCSDSSNPISNSTQDKDGPHRRLKFKSEAEWTMHVENSHLKTNLDLMDGLSTQSSVVESSDRLSESDSHGRQEKSKAKGPAVPVSPVQDDSELEEVRARFNAH